MVSQSARIADMNTYRIFTNDRGRPNGIPMYSALMEVKAVSADAARRQCPSDLDAPNFAPAKAILWPESLQTGGERAWLKRHVG